MRKPRRDAASFGLAYDLFILGLSLYVLFAFVVQVTVDLPAHTDTILRHADTFVCVLFFADFLLNIIRAPDRLRYLRTWGWLDLLSSIPYSGPLRLARLARVLRIIRVLRGFRSVRHVTMTLLEHRNDSAIASVSFVAILLVVFSSMAVLELERNAPGANILTAEDALWWAYCTITTVGYGDMYPVTGGGRLVGVVLMTAGAGVFGTFTAFIASWFVRSQRGRRSERRSAHDDVQ